MGKIAQAIGITLSYLGATVNDTVIAMMERDLQHYTEQDVLTALEQCRKECRGRLAFADIIDRLPNGHPGVEEAWAIELKFRNERDTVVRTDEMREASAVSFDIENTIQARMAYKEIYEALMIARRRDQYPPAWTVSLGAYKPGIEPALSDAVEKGRISGQTYENLVLFMTLNPELIAMAERIASTKALE